MASRALGPVVAVGLLTLGFAPAAGADSTAPEFAMFLGGSQGNAGWWRSYVRVALECLDAESGVASITYSLNGGAPRVYTRPFDVTSEGVNNLVATCTDHAGNAASLTASIPIDTKPPVVVLSSPLLAAGPGWVVEVQASDPTSGLAGVLEVQERASLGPWATVFAQPVSGPGFQGSFARDPSGPLFCYRGLAGDLAGNAVQTVGAECTLRA